MPTGINRPQPTFATKSALFEHAGLA